MEMRQVGAAIHSTSKSHEAAARARYRNAREATGYWAMIDLRSSAAFRQSVGDEAGYIRSEAFIATVRDLVEHYDGLELFKELGDGILMKSENFRPLFETACVLDAVRRLWRVETEASRRQPSFEYRFAITSGTCTRIERPTGPDYLGEPLDLVARTSGHEMQDSCAIAVVTSNVRAEVEQRISREYSFARFGPDLELERKLTKPGEAARWINEITVDRENFLSFSDYFQPLRAAVGRVDESER